MPNQDEIALAKYRIEKANNCLSASKLLLDDGLYADSANRSYYAIFHSIRAVNILDGFDASKHSSVIAHFNWHYVHTGEFEREIYGLLMEPIALEKNAIIVISFWL